MSPLVAGLRRRHQQLIRASGSGQGPSEEANVFAQELIDAGRSVASGRDRDALRKMLYYWTADAMSAGELGRDKPLPALLPYEGSDDSAPADHTQDINQALGAEQLEASPETRAAIRISALARQWQVAGRDEGYLLTGTALAEAKPLKDRDPEIRVFVEESEAAAFARETARLAAEAAEQAAEAARARAQVIRWRVGFTVAIGVVAVVGFLAWQLWRFNAELNAKNADLDAKNTELNAKNVDLGKAVAAKDLAFGALIAESGRESEKTRNEARAAIEALNAEGDDPTHLLKALLRRIGEAQTSELARLQVKPAEGRGNVTASENTVAAPAQQIVRSVPNVQSTCEGVLWLGNEADRLVTNEGPLTSLQANTTVTLRDGANVRLRRGMPSSSYVMAPQIGVVPGGAKLVLKSAPEAHKSPTGTTPQFYAWVISPREYCTRVYVQYIGAESKVQSLRTRLIDLNMQVPQAQAVKVTTKTPEVRVFHKVDYPMAELVAKTLSPFNDGKPLAIRDLYEFPTNPAEGTLEVWIDLGQ